MRFLRIGKFLAGQAIWRLWQLQIHLQLKFTEFVLSAHLKQIFVLSDPILPLFPLVVKTNLDIGSGGYQFWPRIWSSEHPATALPAPCRPCLIPGGMLQSRGMKYSVAVLPTKEGYSVSCPGLPGCWSQGATEEQALANIQDAIREYVEVAKQLAGEQNIREVEVPV